MITSTKKDIVQYINKHGRVRAHDLIRRFNISNVAVHKQLNRLISEDILSKIGKPPLVFYVINDGHKVKNIII